MFTVINANISKPFGTLPNFIPARWFLSSTTTYCVQSSSINVNAGFISPNYYLGITPKLVLVVNHGESLLKLIPAYEFRLEVCPRQGSADWRRDGAALLFPCAQQHIAPLAPFSKHLSLHPKIKMTQKATLAQDNPPTALMILMLSCVKSHNI